MATETGVRSTTERELPVSAGAVSGVLAFLAGYVLTFVVKANDVSDQFTRSLSAMGESGFSQPGEWQVISWFYFQMHNVATETTLSGGGITRTATTSGSVETWLLLVPIVVLLVAGFVVARRANARDATEGARAGATVVIGYAVLVVLVLFVSTWGVSVDAFGATATLMIRPAVVPGILLAGLLYPLVAGAVGGAVAGETAG